MIDMDFKIFSFISSVIIGKLNMLMNPWKVLISPAHAYSLSLFSSNTITNFTFLTFSNKAFRK